MQSHVRPPADRPLGGLMCVRHSVALLAILVLAAERPLGAQLIRGTIRAQGTESVVPGAHITVLDSLGRTVTDVLSDAAGHFTLGLANGKAFSVTVKKIGWQPSSTDLIHATAGDTLDMDLLVPADGFALPGVEITGTKEVTRNVRAYQDAHKLGWRVYEPAEIESHRSEFSSFENMMRALSVTGVKMPANARECYVNTRNNRCLTFVVDGQAVGTMWLVNPVDVYFIAILQQTESEVQFGDKAPYGAIVVFTRMKGDKLRP